MKPNKQQDQGRDLEDRSILLMNIYTSPKLKTAFSSLKQNKIIQIICRSVFEFITRTHLLSKAFLEDLPYIVIAPDSNQVQVKYRREKNITNEENYK